MLVRPRFDLYLPFLLLTCLQELLDVNTKAYQEIPSDPKFHPPFPSNTVDGNCLPNLHPMQVAPPSCQMQVVPPNDGNEDGK